LLSEAQRITLASSTPTTSSNTIEENSNIVLPKQVRVSQHDHDQLFSVKLAARSFDSTMIPNRTQSISSTTVPSSDNYIDDGILVQQILKDLHENVLSDGTEYSGDELARLFTNVTQELRQK
jgi:hypothetical protein